MSGVDEGALCLSSSLHVSSGSGDANGSHQQEDRHKAPASTLHHPLSLQDGGRHFLSFPDSIVKDHQDVGSVSFHSPIRFTKIIRTDDVILEGS